MHQSTSNTNNPTKNISYKRKSTGDNISPEINKKQKTSQAIIIDLVSSDEEDKDNFTKTISSKKRKSIGDDTTPQSNKKQKTPQEFTAVIDLSSSEEEDEDKSSGTCKKQVEGPNPLILDYQRISLYKNDLDCLNKKEWLKDNVVDLALAESGKKLEKPGQAYLFNSLFSKLRSIRNSNSDKKDYYTATKRWFKSEELSNKRFWIIPVCDKYHWYIIIVARPRSNRPVITVLDSIKKKEYESVNLVKAFLKQKYSAEHTGRCKKIGVNIVDIPQQTNNSDCGLFAVRSANLFLMKNAQQYYDLIMDPKKNEAKINQIYEKLPVPTRRKIHKNIQNLIKNH